MAAPERADRAAAPRLRRPGDACAALQLCLLPALLLRALQPLPAGPHIERRKSAADAKSGWLRTCIHFLRGSSPALHHSHSQWAWRWVRSLADGMHDGGCRARSTAARGWSGTCRWWTRTHTRCPRSTSPSGSPAATWAAKSRSSTGRCCPSLKYSLLCSMPYCRVRCWARMLLLP